MSEAIYRCRWCENGSDLDIAYHDTEWGVPLHDDDKLFEFLILDSFQAGLSWSIILKKREGFRRAFENFDAERIAQYDDRRIAELLQDEGIVRNTLKVNSAVTNARAFLEVQRDFESFDEYIWSFTGGHQLANAVRDRADYPTRSPESDAMSKSLKNRGFKFVGTTICYAFMQAAGIVNDHEVECFRHGACLEQ